MLSRAASDSLFFQNPIYKTTRCHIPEYRNISNIGNDVKSKNYVHQEETRVRLMSESAFCRSVYGIFSHVASKSAVIRMYKGVILSVALCGCDV